MGSESFPGEYADLRHCGHSEHGSQQTLDEISRHEIAPLAVTLRITRRGDYPADVPRRAARRRESRSSLSYPCNSGIDWHRRRIDSARRVSGRIGWSRTSWDRYPCGRSRFRAGCSQGFRARPMLRSARLLPLFRTSAQACLACSHMSKVFSSQRKWMRATGMPYASFTSGSIST